MNNISKKGNEIRKRETVGFSSSKGQFFPYKDENVSKTTPYVTYALIAANVAIFLWSLTNFEYVINTYGFTPAAASLLTIFTSMFLHGGFDHIFGNMWYLWLFGDNVEDRMGKPLFIAFYLLSGIAATATHYITNFGSIVPAIGASGAISGVLGAYWVMFPHVRVHVFSYYYRGTVSAQLMIGFWFLMQLFFGTASLVGGAGSGIAFWAHVGGFVFGAAAAWAWLKIKKK
ncbi:MAG: rhomboid family intramembrane serine protease [Candidatus Aenigmarchaeota archaeon]|nr:rhomboid family intramembrane serine protease [Candidatus Aenigmarchaeota archaeon]